MIDRKKLSDIYQNYGFKELKSHVENVAVFTIRSGHFLNADIVVLDKDADHEKVYDQYKASGYACATRNYSSSDVVN